MWCSRERRYPLTITPMASSSNSRGILNHQRQRRDYGEANKSVPEAVGFCCLDLGAGSQSPSTTKLIGQPTVSNIPYALGLPSIRSGSPSIRSGPPSINLESLSPSVASVGFTTSAAAEKVQGN